MPTSAAGQEPTWVAYVEDPAGDLSNFITGPLEGPAVADLTGLALAVDGDDLVVRFDVAGEWDAAATESLTDVTYALQVDGDAVAMGSTWVDVSLEDGGWVAEVSAGDLPEPIVLDDVTVADAAVVVRVSLSVLGSPEDLLFGAESSFSDIPLDFDSVGDVEVIEGSQWFDRVPDARDEWLTLTSGVVTWTFAGSLDVAGEPRLRADDPG